LLVKCYVSENTRNNTVNKKKWYKCTLLIRYFRLLNYVKIQNIIKKVNKIRVVDKNQYNCYRVMINHRISVFHVFLLGHLKINFINTLFWVFLKKKYFTNIPKHFKKSLNSIQNIFTRLDLGITVCLIETWIYITLGIRSSIYSKNSFLKTIICV